METRTQETGKPGSSGRLLLGLVFTAAAFGYLAFTINPEALRSARISIDWRLLALSLAPLAGIYAATAWRWKLLQQSPMSFLLALRSTLIGFGANAMLPARGGDVMKMFFVKRETGASLPVLASSLFLEKLFDLVAILLLSLVSLRVVLQNFPGALQIFALAVLGAALFLALLRLRPEWLLYWPALQVRRRKVLRYHYLRISRAVRLLGRFLTLRRQGLPLMIGVAKWFTLQFLFFHLILLGLGVELDYPSVAFLIVLSALGIAMPSAPSGLGVFHASVVTAFRLLDRSPEEGLIVGAVLHLMIHVPAVMCAVAAYFFPRAARLN